MKVDAMGWVPTPK